MIKSFANRMAWRETRASWRHFIYFVVCIAIGVAALVGVGLFAENLGRAIQRETRSPMAGGGGVSNIGDGGAHRQVRARFGRAQQVQDARAGRKRIGTASAARRLQPHLIGPRPRGGDSRRPSARLHRGERRFDPVQPVANRGHIERGRCG